MVQQTIFPFKIEQTSEKLTAHGGLALMAEFNHGIGLRKLTDKYLPMPESNRGFKPSVFVESLVLMLQGGGKALEDIRELEDEKELMRLTSNHKVPSPDATGDWLRRMGESSTKQVGLKGLDKVRNIINYRILKQEERKDYTLDADAVEITGEKFEAFYTYKGNKGYMPMLGFLFESELCLYDEFREGNVSPGVGQKEFYLECKKRMPNGKRIANYRADSASYQAELINELDADDVNYSITADMDKAVKGIINRIEEEEWKEPIKGCGYELAEAVHSMEKTKKAFRLIIKRERNKQLDLFVESENKHYVIATNWSDEEKDAQAVLTWHNHRGQAENFNKELKNGIGMERMPCGQTNANAVFFRIGVIAYNLFIGFKKLTCPKDWIKHTIATFRWKMVQVAGRIVRHAGAIILKLALEIKKIELFRSIRQKSWELCLEWSG